MEYVIAYDICEPKRLRRVARALERVGTRCQKSVFWFRGTAAELQAILDQAARRMDLSCDVLQAWRIYERPPQEQGPRDPLRRGAAPLWGASGVVLSQHEPIWIYSPIPGDDETNDGNAFEDYCEPLEGE